MTSFDASEVAALAQELGGASERMIGETVKVGRRGANNVKRDWREAAGKSRYFAMGHTINYDERDAFGVYEAEVGPDRRYRYARLAGIAHFGGANGGGGTLGDPSRFAEAEAPRLADALADAAAKAVLR